MYSDERDGSDRDPLIAATAPITDRRLTAPALQSALLAVLDEHDRTTAGPLPARHTARPWRRRIAWAGIGAVMAFGGIGTAAAATGGGLFSGWFDSTASSESVREEEYVDTSSPQFPAAFDRAATGYPLPPGQTWDEMRRNQISSGALVQLTGLRGSMALYSSCAWSGAWLDAHRAHDKLAMRAATEALTRISETPDLAAVDGGGIVARQRKVAAAATTGNADGVRQARTCGGDE